ncbi:MAG: ECF-type sigma factor [Candidatus Eisenbacteria bacterium]
MGQQTTGGGKGGDAMDLNAELHARLRAIAEGLLRKERAGHTLQPTALVHEAFVRAQRRDAFGALDLSGQRIVLAREMRWVLVDYARAADADKRGGKQLRVTLDEAIGRAPTFEVDVMALEFALQRLEDVDPLAAEMVQLRFFGGLTEVEIAERTGLARRTVQKSGRGPGPGWVVSWVAETVDPPAPQAKVAPSTMTRLRVHRSTGVGGAVVKPRTIVTA